MIEKRMEGSRRKLLGALAVALSSGLVSRIPRAAASDKMSRLQAEYQDTPNGLYSCGMCSLFEVPNACKVVEGEISTDGWCKAFALLD